MAWHDGGFEFPEYVSVAERRARARAVGEQLARKRGRTLAPVGPLEGNQLVRTFWGKAWCRNLESYSDYASRLPRGRSYARHGAVIDLEIASGQVTALVSGTSTYKTTVTIGSLHARRWSEIAAACMGRIDSLVDLLRGTLSRDVMEIVTRKDSGLFPAPDQISFACSCADWAGMCKHVAAVLYGVGVRFDEKPELLFALRGVDHADLIAQVADRGPKLVARPSKGRKVIKSADLSALFGIDVEETTAPPATPSVPVPARKKKGQAASRGKVRP
jgi:uncharacterized Zn finger protein